VRIGRFGIVDDSHVVSRDRGRMEELIDLVTGREEMLCLLRRREALHLPRSCHYTDWCGFPSDC
jgi:hypothetical protein